MEAGDMFMIETIKSNLKESEFEKLVKQVCTFIINFSIMRQTLILLSITFFLLSCGAEKTPELNISSIPSPTSENSLTPRLFTSSNGEVLLSWLEKHDEMTKLKFSKFTNDVWNEPQLINEGDNWFVNWADFPSLIANESSLTAHWLQKRAKGTYDYDIRISQSQNDGNSWSESFVLHSDGIAAEHGFVSMLPMANDQSFATWLDGRNTKTEQASGNHGGHGGGAMTLRAGTLDNNGNMIAEWELDQRTCDCCQTTAAMTSNGPVVAYRNRSENEIRDIYITRLIDNAWTEPKPVYNDNWEISGCPVNGPSMDSRNNLVAITWFTAANGYGEVKLSISKDAADNFSQPIVLSRGKTNGRVGTLITDNDQIVVSWAEVNEDKSNIMLAVFDSSGKELIRKMIAETSAARASGFPVITTSKDEVLIAWTETGNQSKVKTSLISMKNL